MTLGMIPTQAWRCSSWPGATSDPSTGSGLADAAVGQHRMHPVLAGGAHADQADPVTQQGPHIPDLLGGDPSLGQQIHPQQLGQGGRIHLVVLEPGRGDGLAAAGMDQVGLQLQFLEQLDQPAPAVGGLERHRGARRKGAKDRYQLGRVIGQVAVALGDTGVVHDGDLRALAMHIHPDLHPHQGLLPRARLVPEA
jgi:hypothetical protein